MPVVVSTFGPTAAARSHRRRVFFAACERGQQLGPPYSGISERARPRRHRYRAWATRQGARQQGPTRQGHAPSRNLPLRGFPGRARADDPPAVR